MRLVDAKSFEGVTIYQEDANKLAKKIHTDIVYMDPPYNSRQYSRFYHVYEVLVKWDKPQLKGVARKPAEENMSNYCRVKALSAFTDLVENIDARYIVVSYNNTYKSKSSSSENKIKLEQIESVLNRCGTTKVFTHKYQAFNAGKTEFDDHKEYLFITTVDNEKRNSSFSSIYVGDKYKLIRDIKAHFPHNIDRFIEPFVGGGSVMMNVDANSFMLNDINSYVIAIHRMLCSYINNKNDFYDRFFNLAKEYGLSLSFADIQFRMS